MIYSTCWDASPLDRDQVTQTLQLFEDSHPVQQQPSGFNVLTDSTG
jgi:hypothetical protein